MVEQAAKPLARPVRVIMSTFLNGFSVTIMGDISNLLSKFILYIVSPKGMGS
jgi:hypothetical protein